MQGPLDVKIDTLCRVALIALALLLAAIVAAPSLTGMAAPRPRRGMKSCWSTPAGSSLSGRRRAGSSPIPSTTAPLNKLFYGVRNGDTSSCHHFTNCASSRFRRRFLTSPS